MIVSISKQFFVPKILGKFSKLISPITDCLLMSKKGLKLVGIEYGFTAQIAI
jgi:hypothetical protein